MFGNVHNVKKIICLTENIHVIFLYFCSTQQTQAQSQEISFSSYSIPPQSPSTYSYVHTVIQYASPCQQIFWFFFLVCFGTGLSSTPSTEYSFYIAGLTTRCQQQEQNKLLQSEKMCGCGGESPCGYDLKITSWQVMS